MFKNKIEKNNVKINGKENFKKIFLEFLSWFSQTNSNCEMIFFLIPVLKKEADIEGIRNNDRRIIPVGKKLRNWFVAKSKEENRSFIIW